jgi:hypothetical protein
VQVPVCVHFVHYGAINGMRRIRHHLHHCGVGLVQCCVVLPPLMVSSNSSDVREMKDFRLYLYIAIFNLEDRLTPSSPGVVAQW